MPKREENGIEPSQYMYRDDFTMYLVGELYWPCFDFFLFFLTFSLLVLFIPSLAYLSYTHILLFCSFTPQNSLFSLSLSLFLAFVAVPIVGLRRPSKAPTENRNCHVALLWRNSGLKKTELSDFPKHCCPSSTQPVARLGGSLGDLTQRVK
jgi:hypothetical protein